MERRVAGQGTAGRKGITLARGLEGATTFLLKHKEQRKDGVSVSWLDCGRPRAVS